jgi:hypothetical protein
MNRYGAGFPVWLAEFEPLRPVPYVGDVAHFERLRRHVFHAPRNGRPAPRAETLTATAPEDPVFALRQGLGVLNVRYAVTQLWEYALAHATRESAPTQCRRATRYTINHTARAQYLAWRDGAQVRHSVLQREDTAFLLDLAAGLALGHACERATRPDPQFQAGACLAGAIGRDILVSA